VSKREEGRGDQPIVFTVGHGAGPVEDLISLLEGAGIRRLVDIRTAPGSRRHPQFGKDALAMSLDEHGIEYVWRKDLGGWRRPHAGSPHVALTSPSFRGYADYMDSDAFSDAIAWLIDSARQTPTAIICAESLWWRCHRRLVSDALVVRGCSVVHLLAGGRQEVHVLHPAARVRGMAIVYDRKGSEPAATRPARQTGARQTRRPRRADP
jgi:uncharacterized protein (DUF488 family)